MNLTMGDVGNMISALNEAIESNKNLIDMNLPPGRAYYSTEDEDNFEEWSQNIKVYRKLRAKLARIENKEAGHAKGSGKRVSGDRVQPARTGHRSARKSATDPGR